MLINILFIIALTFPVAVASTAFSVSNEQLNVNNLQLGRKLMFALILALGQGVMYSLGSLLGGTFMHLLTSLSKWIVLALCFSVSFRMLIDTLKIRKGDNLLFIESKKHLLLLSIALGVNCFIIGMTSEFFQPFQNLTSYIIMIAAFVWSIVAMIIPFSKLKLTLNSMLNVIFAAIILVRGLLFII
ncbi:MAG: manganese efflux pump [Bacteroidales bacterium]|nr:manganese efflux pump [Bacteroidales bacterium]